MGSRGDMRPRLTSQALVSFRPGARKDILAALVDSRGLRPAGSPWARLMREIPYSSHMQSGPALRHYGTTAGSSEIRRGAKKQLSQLQQMLPVEWIGDWHSHPESMFEPSLKDVSTAQALLDDPELGFDSYLMVIVCPQSTRPPLATALLFSREPAARVESTDLGPPEFQRRPKRILRLTLPSLRGHYKPNHRTMDSLDRKKPHDV